ncbi:glycoside hydrolase family 25 protein [Longimicrobium sp.]|uniref:glycoside hydrolase family 25 protein n=1 Tax=Longimicrobium sp. TaxID=2029185 RepID=UPI002C4FB112|nr:glycoside hydrolase family 25 protein [Longimicrobium sp.]HSU14782.1 glycoside hydrolase family 25 protein [Longimicrobium sp.]
MLRLKLVSAAVVPALVAGAHALSGGGAASPSPVIPAVAAVAAAPVSVSPSASTSRTAADDGLSARGIDVSHYQGRIDWAAVEGDGVGFAFVKATEGATFVDPAFRRNWAAMGETRILRGAYHRFRPGRDARAQAEHFLAVVRVTDGDLPPVLDVEATDGVSDARLVRGVRAWLAEVERRTGVRPVVYTKPGFRRAHLGSALDDYPLWIAEYGVESPSHPRWTFWQHSERGRVAGIPRAVDLDRFNGSRAELRQLASAGARSGDAQLAER